MNAIRNSRRPVAALLGLVITGVAALLVSLGAGTAHATEFDPQPDPPGAVRGFDPQPDPPTRHYGIVNPSYKPHIATPGMRLNAGH
ncbi:hypothetical protein [Mycolicibacterium sp. 120270]|uniref:hypothetical protein n=1 Tax=Mycolicibacterium sp. 120270 TaxID=3090600 RepID=UPI00299E2FE7|nr:hypothetical protein [Mycolicibacterium sp. 120270]MDX1883832.1 hypothetical protein [Mycolicibacterium sp. 120270]